MRCVNSGVRMASYWGLRVAQDRVHIRQMMSFPPPLLVVLALLSPASWVRAAPSDLLEVLHGQNALKEKEGVLAALESFARKTCPAADRKNARIFADYMEWGVGFLPAGHAAMEEGLSAKEKAKREKELEKQVAPLKKLAPRRGGRHGAHVPGGPRAPLRGRDE